MELDVYTLGELLAWLVVATILPLLAIALMILITIPINFIIGLFYGLLAPLRAIDQTIESIDVWLLYKILLGYIILDALFTQPVIRTVLNGGVLIVIIGTIAWSILTTAHQNHQLLQAQKR